MRNVLMFVMDVMVVFGLVAFDCVMVVAVVAGAVFVLVTGAGVVVVI